MKAKNFLLAAAACLASLSMSAQENYGDLVPLHIDGRFLKDPSGNTVVLHGVMDTPNPYFNSYRWGGDCSDANVSNCVNYFNKLFTAITDSASGAYCSIFRLHLDPCWTNDPSKKSDGKESGEADISRYSGERLTKYMRVLYWKIAAQAMKHGLYVIMRPPGVCPHNIQVGGYYQDYLIDVWDRVTKNDSVLKYSGQVSIELANEPITVLDKSGKATDQALHDFFQPIVDKIRANGFKGIIWVPGRGYQSNYEAYAKYPITGEQIGYAVHNYAGWFGASDQSDNHEASIKEFGRSVPIMRTNPIVITEVDWSPLRQPLVFDHNNEWGDPVYKNYGTWATASTSKWGGAYRAILDYFGNVSMTLTGTSDYIDIDKYISKNQVVPAFKEAMEKDGLDPYEACGVACFQWYEEFSKVNYPSTYRYQPKQEIPENPFELSKEWFNPSILYEGSAQHSTAATIVTMQQGGCAGWRFEEEEGIDLSDYKYLVIRLVRNAAKNTYFRIYDTANYWAEPYLLDMGVAKEFKIDLHAMQTESGAPVDPSHIRIAGFNTAGAEQTLYVKEVFLSMDGDTPATGISSAIAGNGAEGGVHYSLDGRIIPATQKGIHIIKYKNGTVKKELIK